MTKVCLIDYGAGNVGSVENLLRAMNVDVVVSNAAADLAAATHLVLPGVGAFQAAMSAIHDRVPLAALKDEVFGRRKPFLGVCVGMQVLASHGEEFGRCEGLGWIPGVVARHDAKDEPLPHVGWNAVDVVQPSPLLRGFPPHVDFYFVHSFSFQHADPKHVLATTDYGTPFPSVVGSGNVFGVQFHPEKSQRAGKLLFENFLAMSFAENENAPAPAGAGR